MKHVPEAKSKRFPFWAVIPAYGKQFRLSFHCLPHAPAAFVRRTPTGGNAGIAKIDRILKEFFSRFDPRGRNPLTNRKLSVNEIAIIIFNLLAKDSGTTKTYAAPFKNEKSNIRDVPIFFFFVHHTLQD